MKKQSKGLALTLVILIILMVTFVGGAAMSLGYNQRLLVKKAVGSRTRAYYYAKAGIVDAFELLRKDPGGKFTDPKFDPDPYTLDAYLQGGICVMCFLERDLPCLCHRFLCL